MIPLAWVVLGVLLILLASILSVYFLVYRSSSSDNVLKKYLDGSRSLRVSAYLMGMPNELEEYSDNLQYCGASVDGTSDSTKLYFLTSELLSDLQVSMYENSAVALTSSISWPSALAYDNASMSLSSDDALVAVMNSSPDATRLVMLSTVDLSIMASIALETSLSSNQFTFVGPTIGVFSDGYRVFWLSADEGLRSIALDSSGALPSGGSSEIAVSGVPFNVTAYTHNSTSRVLVAVIDGNHVNEYRYDVDLETYALIHTYVAEDTVINVALSADSTRLVVALDNGSNGSFIVLHRSHVDDPWLKSAHSASTRASQTASNRFGSVMRIFGSEYLLVGGNIESELEVWNMDVVTGTPVYFYTVDTGHVPSRRSFISPVLDSDDRVWIATGSSRAFRGESVEDGRLTLTYADVSTRSVEVGDSLDIYPEVENVVQVTCSSGDWSSTKDNETFLRDDGDITDRIDTTTLGDSAVLVGGGYIVQLSMSTGEFLYESLHEHPYLVPLGLLSSQEPSSRFLAQSSDMSRLVVYQNFTYDDASHPEFRTYNKDSITTTAYEFSFSHTGSYLAHGETSKGPWLLTTTALTQYDQTGALLQSISGASINADTTNSSIPAIVTGSSDGIIRVLMFNGSWVQVSTFDRSAEPVSLYGLFRISIDGLTVIVRDATDASRGHTAYQRSSISSSLMSDVGFTPNEYSGDKYRTLFQLIEYRRTEHIMNEYDRYVSNGQRMYGIHYQSRVVWANGPNIGEESQAPGWVVVRYTVHCGT